MGYGRMDNWAGLMIEGAGCCGVFILFYFRFCFCFYFSFLLFFTCVPVSCISSWLGFDLYVCTFITIHQSDYGVIVREEVAVAVEVVEVALDVAVAVVAVMLAMVVTTTMAMVTTEMPVIATMTILFCSASRPYPYRFPPPSMPCREIRSAPLLPLHADRTGVRCGYGAADEAADGMDGRRIHHWHATPTTTCQPSETRPFSVARPGSHPAGGSSLGFAVPRGSDSNQPIARCWPSLVLDNCRSLPHLSHNSSLTAVVVDQTQARSSHPPGTGCWHRHWHWYCLALSYQDCFECLAPSDGGCFGGENVHLTGIA